MELIFFGSSVFKILRVINDGNRYRSACSMQRTSDIILLKSPLTYIICLEKDSAMPVWPVKTAKAKERSLNRISISGNRFLSLQTVRAFSSEMTFKDGPREEQESWITVPVSILSRSLLTRSSYRYRILSPWYRNFNMTAQMRCCVVCFGVRGGLPLYFFLTFLTS